MQDAEKQSQISDYYSSWFSKETKRFMKYLNLVKLMNLLKTEKSKEAYPMLKANQSWNVNQTHWSINQGFGSL